MKKIYIIITVISYVLASKEELLHYVTDEIAGGSYRYYSLMYDGFIKIQLSSETGDADLYISQTNVKPTYEPDHYCLQSTTCGEDTVLIPDSFKRPVSIGVYGHPSYEISKYILVVCKTINNEDISYEAGSKNIYSSYNNENREKSVATSVTWYFLDLLFQILFW